MPVAMRIWLTILVCWPAPGPPWRIHFEPIAFQSGSSAATVSASPPIMIESVALRAPTSPPETGASMLTTPRFGGRVGNLDGQRRLARRHVDEHAARLRAGQRAVVAENHFANVLRESRRSRTRRRTAAATSRGESAHCAPRSTSVVGLRLGAIENGDLVAGVDQVAAHRAAHHAGADPADARFLG